MFSLNGIGTTIYGKREMKPEDDSYIVTKWIVFLFFPIVPLGSYRVIKEKQKFLSAEYPKYQMAKVALHRRQVVNTYLAWWGTLIVLAALYAGL